MKRLLIVLLLLAPPAMGQAPAPADVIPKATASVRPSYPAGSVVVVDATGTATEKPVIWQVLGRPNVPAMPFDALSTPADSRKGLMLQLPALDNGHYTVAVTAIGHKGADPLVDTFVVQFDLGPPPPAPDAPVKPDVPDTPKPAPATPIQSLGLAYASADVKAMADTWEESATMVAAGNAVGEVMKSFGQRWAARRTPAFAPAGTAFSAIVPAGTEPATQASRDALVAAWKDFAAGLRLGVAK